ncbi:MAG: NADH-quinone oxidoreductase subunit J [Planctomycetales bacterium]|nr:NADH-quinone oxidoreductase subunit J [Planctomycetales bacterium]
MNLAFLAQASVDSATVWERVSEFSTSATTRIAIASILLGLALYLMLPGGTPSRKKWLGVGSGIIGVCLVWSLVPMATSLTFQSAFWLMASVAVVASTATVTSRSPVYSAIWFAVSLLGIAGLFLLQGAQFLGIATVAVYAGAIVVTFLFVLMLAQPEGHSFYDRITWGTAPRVLAPFLAAALMAILANAVTHADSERITLRQIAVDHIHSLDNSADSHVNHVSVQKFEDGIAEIHVAVSAEPAQIEAIKSTLDPLKRKIAESLPTLADSVIRIEQTDSLQHSQHVAHLGSNLFGRYLIVIQLVGGLLLVALVGAVAIASHGSEPPKSAAVGTGG